MINTHKAKELTNNGAIQSEYFKILVSNTSKSQNNISTFIKGVTTSGEIVIDGSFSTLPSDLFVIGEEIVKVISHIYNSTTKETQLTVERGYFGSPLTSFLVGDLVNSVIDVTLDVDQYNYNSKMDISNNPFLVSYGTSNVRLRTKVAYWTKYSKRSKYNYNNYKTRVYIFEGYDKKCVLTFTGFLKKLSTNSSNPERQSITFNCVDQLGTYWDKDIKNKTQIKDMSVDEALAQILEIPLAKIYFKHIDKSKYPKIEMFTLNDYTTYKELFEIFSSNGIRFFFTPKGHLHIFSEVMDNGNLVANRHLDDVRHLTNISLTNDSQLVYNYYNITQRKRFPLYDVDKGFNYKYSKRFNNLNFLYKDVNGDYQVKEITLHDTDIPPRIALDEHGKPSVLMLKEVNSGLEFICNPIEIYSDRFTIVPISIYNDTGLLDFGKGQYLESLNFLGNLDFELYYVNGNLPTVFSLSKSENKGVSALTNNLEIPITPVIKKSDGTVFRDLNKDYTLQFGSPQNLKDLTYTNSYVGIDKLKGLWKGGIDLLWNREWEQSQRGLDVFVNSTRTTNRSLCDILPYYDTFDNSGLELKIFDKINDNTIKSKFFNTVRPELDLDFIETVDFTRSEIIGDIGILPTNNLRPHDILFPIELLTGYDAYEKVKFDEAVAGGIEIVVNSKTTYNNETILVLNNPVFPNIKYGIIRLEDIVYVQNFFIKLNPIVEQTSELNYINYPSVEEYDGRKEFTLGYTLFNETYTKKLISYINSGYAGTGIESCKYVLPINTIKTLDLELYDMVAITDNTITEIQSNWLFMIVGKTVAKNPNRSIEYTLLNVYTNEIEYIDLKVAEVQKFNPLEEPTFQHSGIEQEKVEVDEYETRIQINDSRRGKLVGHLISPEDFVFKAVIDAVSPAFDVEITGKLKAQYIAEYFPEELYKAFIIVKIQKEYIYASGFSYKDANGDTKYRLQLLTRQLGNTPIVENLSNQKIVAYKIAEGSTKQYGLSTSSIYVGNGSDSGYMSFNPVEGLRIKAKSIVMSTGEPIATTTDINNTNKDLTDLINSKYNSSITYSDSKFELNKNAITLLNNTVLNQGNDIVNLNSQFLVQQGNISSIVQEQKNIKGDITTTNSKIDQTATNLQLSINSLDGSVVKKNNVLASINLSTEGVKIWGDKLVVDSRTEFMSDVQLNGNITGDRGIVTVTPDGKKRTQIRGGTIQFLETNVYGQLVPTRTFRKMATDVYNFNPSAIQWVDVRKYTGNVNWDNVKIVAGLSSANLESNTRLIKCEVIQNPSDPHLFYITVGGSYVQESAMGMWGSDSVPSKPPTQDVYYRGFSGVASFRVDYTSTVFYVEAENHYNSYGISSSKVTEYTRYHRCWYRYKPVGTGSWTGWILGSSANLDPTITGQLFDVEVRVEAYNEYIKKYTSSSFTTSTTPSNTQVNFYASNKVVMAVQGGNAYWFAYEQ